MNATLKALAEDLTYCEGYMTVYNIPIHHGWCVTREGKVIDPTIDGETGRVGEYFGIPFTRDYLLKASRLNKVYGILGFMSKTQRQLLDGKVKQFRATLEGE